MEQKVILCDDCKAKVAVKKCINCEIDLCDSCLRYFTFYNGHFSSGLPHNAICGNCSRWLENVKINDVESLKELIKLIKKSKIIDRL